MNPIQPHPTHWDHFVTTHPNGSLLQLTGWGRLKARYGWLDRTVALTRDDAIVSGATILYKRQFGLTLAYVHRGPVVDWNDRPLVEQTLTALRAQAHRDGASILKLEPELYDTAENRALLRDLGLRPSPQSVQPRSSIVVSLADGPDAALAAMKSKWRYNVRLAERKGVTVREATAADLPAIADLMRATAERDNFDVHEAGYYNAAFELLAPDHMVFLLAEFEGAPLSAIVVGVSSGMGVYLWGASGERERNRMPNHALQWAGMQWAHARGATRYDLWGIPDELGQLASSLRGATSLTDRFSGDQREDAETAKQREEKQKQEGTGTSLESWRDSVSQPQSPSQLQFSALLRSLRAFAINGNHPPSHLDNDLLDGSGTPSDTLPVDVESLPAHGLWGVYRFKQGFGGEVVRMVGAWDMPVRPAGDLAYRTGLEAKRYFGDVARRYRDNQREDAETAKKREEKQKQEGIDSALDPSRVIDVDSQAPSQLQFFAFLRTLRAFAMNQSPLNHQISNLQEWRKTLATLPNPHLLQSWEWGAVKSITEWRAERILIEPGAAMQFLWRQPVPGIPLRIAYVPKGPTLDWTDAALVERTLAALERHARARRCILVKIDPDVLQESPQGAHLIDALKRRGWLYSNEQIQFKNTGVSDLTLGESAILEGMKQKTRYNIRLAEKRGITIRHGTEADFDAFYALYAETGASDGFLIRPLDYYRTTWQTFLRAQQEEGSPTGGVLLLAEAATDEGSRAEGQEPRAQSQGPDAFDSSRLTPYDSRLTPSNALPLPLALGPAILGPAVAGIFLLRHQNTTWYFYGASSDRNRRDMPNYLLQWEALKWAKSQGCTRYDWWGAPTNPSDPEDSMQGVWGFKEGFGAQLQVHIGAWDYPVSPILYRAYQQALPRLLNFMRRANNQNP